MPRSRKGNAFSLLRGLILAILATLAGMLLIAGALTWLHIPDNSIRFLNQLVKVISVILGTTAAVRRGGEMGLASGVFLGLAYMVLGYALYMVLGGGSFEFASALGEMLIGAAVGAVTGTIRANMSPSRRKA